ncbi:MAG: hypothetical protein HQK53_08750 [Oligoflexia bacterium]|nr:hypothetical protein [Oligoflexia bacterium]
MREEDIWNCNNVPACHLSNVLNKESLCLPPQNSGHQTVKCLQGYSPSKVVFLKLNKHNQPLASILEVALGNLYRALMGKYAAKGALVKDESNKVVGTISYDDTGGTFKDFTQFTEQEKPSIKKQINSGLADVLTSAHFFNENDLHKKNYGADGTGHMVRIDFDMSMWSTTVGALDGYVGHLIKRGGISESPITVENLTKFPVTTDGGWFSPCRQGRRLEWINDLRSMSDSRITSSEESEEYCNLASNDEFQQKKWESFMQLALVPDGYYDGTLKSAKKHCIDVEQECLSCANTIDKIGNDIKARKRKLIKDLKMIPVFHKFLCKRLGKMKDLTCSNFANSLFSSYRTETEERGAGISERDNRPICDTAIALTNNRCSKYTNKLIENADN